MRLKILLILAILYLFGTVNAAVDFPAEEAGISAYVQANSSINLSEVKPALATIERETSDYIIGTVALSLHSEEQYPHLYASTDGWVVAYYPDDRPSSWLLPWYSYSGGDLTTTTLRDAIVNVCNEINGSTEGLRYYDFRNPDASKMMIIIESTTGSNWFNITIPLSYTIYMTDWSHYARIGTAYYSTGSSNTYLDATRFSYLSGYGTYRNYGSFNSTQFAKGEEHIINIDASRGTGRIALVLEYSE